MHSKTGDVKQLRHDLRNGPNYVFGEHHACNPAFCKVALNEDDSSSDSDDGSDTDSGNGSNSSDMQQTLTQQLEDIIQSELDD